MACMDPTRRLLLAAGLGVALAALAGPVRAADPGGRHYQVVVEGMT